jgi:hypothetical protein
LVPNSKATMSSRISNSETPKPILISPDNYLIDS